MSLFVMLLALALLSPKNSVNGDDAIFDVTQYGAKGDGRTDDTEVFGYVFKTACESGYASPLLLIPGGRRFVVHPTDIRGPCKPTFMKIQLDGWIIPRAGGYGAGARWVTFRGISNLRISGVGGVDGAGPRLRGYKGKEHGGEEERDGSETLDSAHDEENKYRDDIEKLGKLHKKKAWASNISTENNEWEKPTNVAFFGCNHLRINGISSSYSERNHISISSCEDVFISNIKIKSPATSKNTDGIDISNSRWVSIVDSNIETGDDCIAINSGALNIIVSNVHCGPGHGISIGSFKRGDANVEYVDIQHCTFTDTTNGARIKSFSDGMGGSVRWVTFTDITLQNVERPIIIDQFYRDVMVDNLLTGAGTDDVQQLQGVVEVNDVKFIGFRGTCSEDIAILLNCNNGPGCNRITMRDVNIRGSQGQPVRAECYNAHGTAESVWPIVDCLNGLVTDNDNEERRIHRWHV